MEKEKHNLISEFYECRILFGYFDEGGCLPMIDTMCDTFQVAPRTIRKALAKLERKGLISISHGKCPTVTYSASREQKQRFVQDYYLTRRDAIQEIYQMSDCFLLALFREGFRRLTDEDLRRIGFAAGQEDSGVASLSILCCDATLNALDNRLLNDLFFEVISFHQFPCLPVMTLQDKRYKKQHEALLDACRRLDREGLYRAFVGLQHVSQDTLQTFIGETGKERPIPAQIPFHWQTYRDRPQRCHSLATLLIWWIIDGKYHAGDFFPSYADLAEEISISVSTVRRAMELLRNMGVVHSINGVGNQVLFSAPNWEALRRPFMQNNLQMTIQSIEILSLTADCALTVIFRELTEEQADALRSAVRKQKGDHILDLLFAFIDCLLPMCPFQLLNEIYQKLFAFLMLAYPLLVCRGKARKDKYETIQKKLMQGLETWDTAMFCHGFREALHSISLQAAEVAEILK